jgi:hypothetical protein
VSPGDPSRPGRTGPARSVPVSSAWLEVRRPGPLATVQDLGRPGLSHLGVPRAGAADAVALRLANALVGNAPGAAGIEATLAGPELVLSHARAVAVTGAAGGWTVGGIEVPLAATVVVPAGEVVAVRPTQRGVRSYVAVEGGIAVPMVLGSRSSDTLSGLGPAPLSTGTSLPLGPAGELSPWLAAPAGHGSAVVRALPPALAALALGERAEEDAWPVLPGRTSLGWARRHSARSAPRPGWWRRRATARGCVWRPPPARPPARIRAGGRASVRSHPSAWSRGRYSSRLAGHRSCCSRTTPRRAATRWSPSWPAPHLAERRRLGPGALFGSGRSPSTRRKSSCGGSRSRWPRLGPAPRAPFPGQGDQGQLTLRSVPGFMAVEQAQLG